MIPDATERDWLAAAEAIKDHHPGERVRFIEEAEMELHFKHIRWPVLQQIVSLLSPYGKAA